MDHGRYNENQPIHIHAKNSTGILPQQFSRITEVIKPYHKESCEEGDHKIADTGIIYPISDNSYVSLVQCVPKKGGVTVVVNEKNKFISTRTGTR